MFYLISLSSSVLLSNIRKLKFFTSTGLIDYSTSLPSTFLLLEALFSVLKTHGSIWGLSLTKSLCSINILISIWTKLSLWSNAWDYLGTCSEVSTLSRNNFFTGVMSSLSCCTNSNCGFTIKPLYCIQWKSSEKYREELPSGSWKPSKIYPWMV